MMVQVESTSEMIANARVSAHNMGVLRNSITSGEGNVAGFVGKYMVGKYLKRQLTKTPEFDFIYNGMRIEVKTKRCTSMPRSFYECSIAEFNPDQRCDYYAFVRVLNDMSRGWILGVMTPDEYFQRCTVKEAGEYDAQNRFTFHCKSYNLPISELHPIDSIVVEEANAESSPTKNGLDRWIVSTSN